MIDNAKTPEKPWFVIWTMPRAEKKVASRIAANGIEAWLPSVTERHRWSDRWREVILPLFPGYLFAKCELSDLSAMLRTPGVLTVVKAGDKPARLTDSFVHALRRAIDSPELKAEPVASHDYSVNEEVLIQQGPLAGMRGVIRQLRGAQQLVVWVQEVGRGVAFTIASALVTPPAGRAQAR